MASMKNSILFISLAALSLAILKLIFGVVSGSIIILASALDSLIDVVFSLLNYFALRKIESPSNKYFNYGFGKLEGLASLFEGCLIFASGIYIIYKSFIKFMNNGVIDSLNQGLFVMIVSICVTLFLVLYLKNILKHKTNLIIEAEFLHYKTDLLSNLAIIISLVVIEITGFDFLDSIIGGLLGVYICYSAFKISKNGLLMLLDKAIDDDLYKKIVDILDKEPKITSYHDLKSRISSNVIFLEYHLVFNENISLFDAHSISNEIERSIEKLSDAYKWTILVHLDPYDDSQ